MEQSHFGAISFEFENDIQTKFPCQVSQECPAVVTTRPSLSDPLTSSDLTLFPIHPLPFPRPFPVPPSPTGQFSGQSGGRWSGLCCPFVGMTLNQLRLSVELLARLFIGAGAARE